MLAIKPEMQLIIKKAHLIGHAVRS